MRIHTMRQKEYPQVIVLKKSLVVIASIGAMLIMLLILHNLYSAAHVQAMAKTENNRSVQAMANEEDISWYQNKIINKPETQPPAKQLQSITHRNNLFSQQANPDVLKAMSAPISSNQLIGTNQTLTSSLTPGNGSKEFNVEQNKQSEKAAFITNSQATDDDYISSSLKDPISSYELQAGTIIPGILITGINSDLPGQIIGQVRLNVYDSISGNYLLIPQGSKLTGLYDSQVAYGQERVLVVWKRIIFPNGQSIDLQGMPGIDMGGYAGFYDQVNGHYGKIFGSVVLMSVLSAGAQLSQPQNNNNPFAAPTVGQTLAQSLGTNVTNTGTMITAKNINIQPTLQIRPGYEFNISVTKDMVFPSPYNGSH